MHAIDKLFHYYSIPVDSRFYDENAEQVEETTDKNDFWTYSAFDQNISFFNGSNYEDFNETINVVPEDVSLNIWWALLASMLVLFTAAGNVLVCLAIYLERRLQNVTNYFLMSLAITDLLVAILVMPLGILTLVRG